MKLMRVNQPDFLGLTSLDALNNLRQEVNRLFECTYGENVPGSDLFAGWAPPLDLSEDQNNLIVEVELPGVKKDDLEVSVHNGVLSISGERPVVESEQKDATYYRQERFHGRFHRSITLPKPVELDAVKADYRNGILTVTLPKTEEARPRQIEVSHD
jgi:HSP20 family protein